MANFSRPPSQVRRGSGVGLEIEEVHDGAKCFGGRRIDKRLRRDAGQRVDDMFDDGLDRVPLRLGEIGKFPAEALDFGSTHGIEPSTKRLPDHGAAH